MSRLIVALALMTSTSVRSMGVYSPVTDEPTNGCGAPCVPLSLSEYLGENYSAEEGQCLVVPVKRTGSIDIFKSKSCVKIVVESGGSVDVISAQSRVPFWPPHETLVTRHVQVDGANHMIVNKGEVNSIQARSRVRCLPLRGPQRRHSAPAGRSLSRRNDDHQQGHRHRRRRPRLDRRAPPASHRLERS